MSDVTPGPPPTTPPDHPATPTLPSRRGLALAIAGGLVVLALGVWLVVVMLPRLLTSPRDGAPAQAAAPPAPPPGEGRREVTLFYVSDTGLELVPVRREIPGGLTPSDKARQLVEAQVHTPPEGQVSAIPPETTVRAVFLAANGEAYVDLGPEIVAHHTGGALDEALAVYAIVNALTTNEAVTSVQILIDGKEVDTLAGHIDLRRPLTKSLDWVHKGK